MSASEEHRSGTVARLPPNRTCSGRRAATFVEGILAPRDPENGTIEVPPEIGDAPSSHE